MKKSYINDKTILITLWITITLLFVLTYAKMGSPYVDCGREAYIPWQMLKGEVLYRDIFNIYAPGAYYFNAILYKIFSPNLNVLYFAAFINYGIIVSLLYLISRFFLSKIRTLILILFVIGISGISGNVFNFMFPYSYGMIYGFSSVLASLYFLLRGKTKSDYYFAALFGGLAAVFKYEFILYVLPLLAVSIYRLKSFAAVLKIVLLYLLFPVLTLIALFVQGVTVHDLNKELVILSEIMKSKTMWYFYSISGISFSPEHIGLILTSSLCFFSSVFFIESKKLWFKIFKFTTVAIFLYIIIENFFQYRFWVFVPSVILFLFIFRFKKLGFRAKVLALTSLFISIKVFFSLMLFSYGTYFVGLMLCTCCILLPVKLRKSYIKVLFICTVYFFIYGLSTLSIKTGKIATPYGNIYAGKVQAIPFMQVYDYLKQNTKQDDKVLCLPEAPMLNFLAQRDTDNYLYSVIPMYVEVFGEYNIIKRIDENKPEYIVISGWNTNSYYFSYFGNDYALGIMNYINEKYEKVFETNYGISHRIYRRKNNEIFTYYDKSEKS